MGDPRKKFRLGGQGHFRRKLRLSQFFFLGEELGVFFTEQGQCVLSLGEGHSEIADRPGDNHNEQRTDERLKQGPKVGDVDGAKVFLLSFVDEEVCDEHADGHHGTIETGAQLSIFHRDVANEGEEEAGPEVEEGLVDDAHAVEDGGERSEDDDGEEEEDEEEFFEGVVGVAPGQEGVGVPGTPGRGRVGR